MVKRYYRKQNPSGLKCSQTLPGDQVNSMGCVSDLCPWKEKESQPGKRLVVNFIHFATTEFGPFHQRQARQQIYSQLNAV